MTAYKVQLDVYQGPLDLLLYLIKREEVDIYDIPIAHITQQYVAYLDLLRILDPDAIAEYLVLLATLIEIKSRMLVPRPPAEVADAEEDPTDPRLELVRQLLEYKRFKDAARELERSAEEHSMRFPPGPAVIDPSADLELDDASVWDLMGAFTRLMAQISRKPALHEVTYDDTPITLHAADILDRLQREDGSLHFERIFLGRSRSEMIGLFLALLELIRQKRVRAEQDHNFGAIIIFLLDPTPLLEVESVVVRFPGAEPAADTTDVDEPESEDEAPTLAEPALLDEADDVVDEEKDTALDGIDDVLDRVTERLEEDRKRRRRIDRGELDDTEAQAGAAPVDLGGEPAGHGHDTGL